MNALIEDYLRARGLQYFRGHHDDEYFFLIDSQKDFFVDVSCGRLHVHLGVSGLLHDTVDLRITPDRFYPADSRDRLAGMAARWTANSQGAEAVVRESSDPALVGISVDDRFRPIDHATLADCVDQTIASAIELFDEVNGEATTRPQAPEILRDAG